MARLLSTTLFISSIGMANAYTVVAMQGFMFKNIDPIVHPGKYNSHMHTFFGSDAVNMSTTTSAELKTGCTTAENLNDHSVYWTPTLYYTGAGSDYTPIYPMRFSAYYENIGAADIIAFPEDFKILVGNAGATTQAEVTNYDGENPNVKWFCEGDDSPADKEPSAFPTTTCSTHLQHLVYFQDCVNPSNISETSYSSSSYGTSNKCPADQKRIPRLRYSVRYDLRKTISEGWSGEPPLALACGNSFCAHGDFINGWDDDALQEMLKATSKTEYYYVSGSLQSGQGGDPTCTAADSDPDHGTSDYLKSVKMQSSMKKREFSWTA